MALPFRPPKSDATADVVRVSRREFIDEIFVPHYEPGQHVAIMGPTQSGKTTLAFDLLDQIASPELPAVILVLKPRDEVVKQFGKLSGFRKIETWPPAVNRAWRKKGGGFGKRQRGWIFWPRHSLTDIERDDKALSAAFKQVLTDCYAKGDRIVFADEILGLSKELNLEQQLNAIWSRGSSMKCGLWAATQRPFNAPLLMYGSSAHLMIFKDGDKRSRERYDEIGGIDDDVDIEQIVLRLKAHEFLYIGRFMAEDEISSALAIVEAR
jgi:energy-coupling factor transporter ATP-binding protein EcfA2